MEGDGGLQIFREVVQSLVDEQPLGDTLDLISRRVSELAGFDFCGIILHDAASQRVQVAGSHGFPPRYESLLNQDVFIAPLSDRSLVGSPTRTAIATGRTAMTQNALTDETFRPWRQFAVEFGYRSLLSVPLVSQGGVIGVLNGYSSRSRTFTAAELATAEALAGQAAIAVRMATLAEARHETIAMLERAHDIHLRLTDAVIAGAGFEAVAQTLSDLIARPVAVTDAGGRLICTSDPPPEDGLVAAALAQLARRDCANVIAVPAGDTVVGHIRIGDELLGRVVVQEGDTATRDLDLRAVEHAATVLALEIVKERVARATEERLQADFLSDLVSGRDEVEERIADRARHHGLAFGLEHRVLVLCLDECDHDHERQRGRVLRLIGDAVSERLPGSLLRQVSNVVTVAAPTERLADPLSVLRHLLDELRRRTDHVAPGLPLSAGIGGVARTPRGFADSHREAVQCVELVQRLGRTGQTVAADELGTLRLVIDSRHPAELAALAQQVLGPVLPGGAGDGVLFDTLDAFLDCGGDVRACAERLYVHPNTVRYRMHRVEELCGLDLRDPNDLLQATLARLIVRLQAMPAGAGR